MCDDDNIFEINPANGLPMINDVIDVEGNHYGTDYNDDYRDDDIYTGMDDLFS